MHRDSESLRTAASFYFHRPALAFLRAFMLEEYARAGIDIRRPVVDLGCGDGTFAAALSARGVMGRPDVGLDGARADVRSARGRIAQGVCADLTALPLRTGVISTVVSTTVLSSLFGSDPGLLDQAMFEVARVLRDGGCFALMVALPGFNANLRGSRVLRWLGADTWARRYISRVNRRHSHTQLHDESVWREKLVGAGFAIQQARYLMTPRVARRYSTLHLARGFPILSWIPSLRLHRWLAAAESAVFATAFRRLFASEQDVAQTERRPGAGFALLIARKGSPPP